MARTISDISSTMLDAIASDERLAALNSVSKVALFRLIIFIVATAIYLHEQIFDTHKQEVDTMLLERLTPNERWYAKKAKEFQYGFSLVPDKDYFENTGFTIEDIEASKIIKYAAVPKTKNGEILIKIATESGDELTPITIEQQEAFEAYIKEIMIAGSKYRIVNYMPDKLFLDLKIYVDPLVIGTNGVNILTGERSVEKAINQFLKELPFDGELVLASLIDKLQDVPGVKIPHLLFATSQPVDAITNEYVVNPQPINVKTISVSGYFTVPNFDNIAYVV